MKYVRLLVSEAVGFDAGQVHTFGRRRRYDTEGLERRCNA